MSKVSRRKFIGGSTAAAASYSISTKAGAHTRTPVSCSEERVVVIGSGFGGGVSALRLGQAGVKVLVLERGRWWRSGPNAETFPHALRPDRRVFFYNIWPEFCGRRIGFWPYVGLLEPVAGRNMTAVVAAGVGGGSLVYQGMTLQPTEEHFNAWFPEQLDYQKMDSIYYPRVAQMLKIKTAPDTLINSAPYHASRIFASRVEQAGYHLTKIPMPIDWQFALDELNGLMKPSYTNGDCAFGVNNGGKHSVDVTYIDQAIATGNVTVEAQHNVREIERAADGSWLVHVDKTNDWGTVLEHKRIKAKTLILSAGTMNTNKLLIEAGARGKITDLPDSLGEGYGSNGDQIYIWSNMPESPGAPQGGPVVYGSFEWDDPDQPPNTIIQASIPPVYKKGTGNSAVPAALIPGASQMDREMVDTKTTMLVGYGISNDRGRFVYNERKNRAELHWPHQGDAILSQRIHERISVVAGEQSTLINTNRLANTTWHPLGGACIDKVCDLEGRVKGQKGLYEVRPVKVLDLATSLLTI